MQTKIEPVTIGSDSETEQRVIKDFGMVNLCSDDEDKGEPPITRMTQVMGTVTTSTVTPSTAASATVALTDSVAVSTAAIVPIMRTPPHTTSS